jgi:hypothetical protein
MTEVQESRIRLGSSVGAVVLDIESFMIKKFIDNGIFSHVLT